MADTKRPSSRPDFVVLRQIDEGQWQLVAEIDRQPGLSARAARAKAIQDATEGQAKPGDVYAAVLRSEWRIALDW